MLLRVFVCVGAFRHLLTRASRAPADDIGWSDFGYFGFDLYGATPTIDTLASQGVKLACVYGQTACTPGRAAFLTGLSRLCFPFLRRTVFAFGTSTHTPFSRAPPLPTRAPHP